MKRNTMVAIGLFLLAFCLVGCALFSDQPNETTQPTGSQPSTMHTESTAVATTEATTIATTATTVPATTVETTAEPTQPTLPTESEVVHSPLYIPGVDVKDVIEYFNEVCLDAEYVNGGDASLLQKWDVPIYFIVHGEPTEEDRIVLSGFTAWLNTIDGFPGIHETSDPTAANLRIYFCSGEELLSHLGDNFAGTDGGVTFWYMDNAIYDAIICYRSDILQQVRNSVILEEIYNGLGPVQDTWLRTDSIIYGGYSEPQSLTQIDELILKLLYHPQLTCGMNADECEAVIRQLYY